MTVTNVDKTSKSQEWYTPESILGPVKVCLARILRSRVDDYVYRSDPDDIRSIGLDPATHESNPTKAWRYCSGSKARKRSMGDYGCGLTGKPWATIIPDFAPTIWLNPPFKGCRPWLERLRAAVDTGRVHALLLLPTNRLETVYVQELLGSCRYLRARVDVRRRVAFEDLDGQPHAQNVYGSHLWAFSFRELDAWELEPVTQLGIAWRPA